MPFEITILGQSITMVASPTSVRHMMVSTELLNSIYTGRLQNLRQRAEECGVPKSGSVEVLRARLIRNEILPDLDLSWEGIQSMPHKKIGEVLKVFGIKSSGSHKERRQRLWLHLNYDSRRMTIENLAEMSRDDLHELCKRLELELTGNRTVLMGRVAGVLTSQINGWGRIKRSLRRNGIQSAPIRKPDGAPQKPSRPPLVAKESFHEVPTEALLEDAMDSFVAGLNKQPSNIQGDLLTIQARVADLERMVGTILRSHAGHWGVSEKELLLRLAERRGWPISEPFVRSRVLVVATNIAEVKGAEMDSGRDPQFVQENSEDAIKRIRKKLASSDTIQD